MEDPPTAAWQNEVVTPLQWLELKKQREKFDINDPWWQNRFIKQAGLLVERAFYREDGNQVLDEENITICRRKNWRKRIQP